MFVSMLNMPEHRIVSDFKSNLNMQIPGRPERDDDEEKLWNCNNL